MILWWLQPIKPFVCFVFALFLLKLLKYVSKTSNYIWFLLNQMAHIIQNAETTMGSLCNPVIAGSAVLLSMAENSPEMCVFDYFLCTRRRKKGGKLSNETELKLWSFIMCGFIFWVAVPPPHCENQTYNQHQGCARGILLKCSHICTSGKSFTSRGADIYLSPFHTYYKIS